ncbi:hypothetical protein LSL4_gp136 [Pseudomonas phage LSL4]|nr:hypothetical protein LSL4_gp136 [Pseudomonas phage LSL4]
MTCCVTVGRLSFGQGHLPPSCPPKLAGFEEAFPCHQPDYVTAWPCHGPLCNGIACQDHQTAPASPIV